MRGGLLGARRGFQAGVLAALLAGSWACGGGGGGGKKDVLQQLGVKKDPPRTDADTLQPLRRKHFVYRPDSQLYISGMFTYSGYFTNPQTHQVLLDGQTADWGALFSTPDADWYTYDSTSTAADLRGEGQQEAVVFYRNAGASPAPTGFLRVTGRDVVSGIYSESGPYQIQADFAFGKPLGSYWNDLQLAAADLDGDGADELVLAAGKTVLVLKYDALSDRFTVLDQIVYRPGLGQDQLTTVAAGDVDQDGRPEVVVVNGAYDNSSHASFYVYNLTDGALVQKETGPLSEANDGGGRDYGFARVAIGDLDGDNVNELAFGGDVFDNLLAVTVYKYDPASGTHQPLTTHEYGINWGLQWMPVVAVFKPDGDPAHNALIAYTNILKLEGGKLAYKFDPNVLLSDPFGDRVTVGDFSDDGRDDVAFIDSGGYLEIWAYDVQKGAYGQAHYWPFWVYASTTLTAVNADRNRDLVLEYTGYEFAYSNPRVLAVLVSPPVYQGQDPNGVGQTTIEWEAGSEVDSTTTHGFYAGLSLGFQAEAPLWGSAASEEFKVNVDTSMDWNFTSGSGQSVASTFFTGAGEDQVVFVSVPYDIYHYTVVSSPDGKAGYDLAIQVPRQAVIQQYDLDLFNSIVPEGYRVPAEAFNPATGERHAPYDPSSYPTHAEMASILPMTANGTATDPKGTTYTKLVPSNGGLGGFRTPDELVFRVGVANTGGSGLSLSNASSSGYGTEFNLQVGIEAQQVTGGVLVEERAGYHYGYSGSYNTTSQTTVSGQVPPIPISMKDAVQPYNVGLFAYPYPNDATAQYIVVNYWVE
jgi:hypothetical protein